MEKFSLKDHLINEATLLKLLTPLEEYISDFSCQKFLDLHMEEILKKELKERIHYVAQSLVPILPTSPTKSFPVIYKSLSPELNPGLQDDDFGEFVTEVFSQYVVLVGCNKEYVDESLILLGEITKRFSVEFAMRDFLNAFPQKTYGFLVGCAGSDNYHMRRLASESLRPSLPWGKKIPIHYKEATEVLDHLYQDQTQYVIRSVANHINDITKIDPEYALDLLMKWRASGDANTKFSYLLRHSLRTLRKDGHPRTLSVLGYLEPYITDMELSYAPLLKIGDTLQVGLTFTSLLPQQLLIYIKIGYRKKNGSFGDKKYVLVDASVEAGSHEFTKKISLKKMSTRTLYPGVQQIEIYINGVQYIENKFFTLTNT